MPTLAAFIMVMSCALDPIKARGVPLTTAARLPFNVEQRGEWRELLSIAANYFAVARRLLPSTLRDRDRGRPAS